MNKKVSIPIMPILIAIVAIVIVVVIISKVTQDEISKLSKIYEKMVTEQTYIFTRYDLEEKNKFITYRKTNKTLIDRYDLGAHVSTLILEGDTYLISHANKEYYVYPNSNLEEEILTDNLKQIIKLEYTTGKEKIYGKEYKYEEYEGVSSYFVISSSNYIDTDSIKVRFYFKGNELVYLKSIYEVVNEETGEKNQVEELQTVKVEYKVEDSMFVIPADYAEN